MMNGLLQYINSRLSKEDVIKVVQEKMRTTNLELEDYNFVPLEGAGMMGCHTILNASAKLPSGKVEEMSFFVKMYPYLESVAEQAVRFHDPVRREGNMYRLFSRMKEEGVSCISEVIPECFYIKGEKVVVMENLVTSGYKIFPKTEHNVDVMIGMVRSLALFHAASVAYESKGPEFSILVTNEEDTKHHFFDFGTESSVNGIIASFEMYDIKVPQLESKIRGFYKKFHEYMKASKTMRNVLCHGDPWPANILISSNKTCKFVDFQFPRYAAPTGELQLVIYLCTDRKFRELHHGKVIDAYYKAFIEALNEAGVKGEKVYPKEQFMESCEEYKLFAIMATQFYLPVILLESEELQELLENTAMYCKSCTHDKSVAYNYARINKEQYFGRIKDGCLDIEELLRNPKWVDVI